MTITVDLTFDQIIKAVRRLDAAEQETLVLMLDTSLRRKINSRRKMLTRERKQRKLLTERDLFRKHAGTQ
jgi:hypothetical protein